MWLVCEIAECCRTVTLLREVQAWQVKGVWLQEPPHGDPHWCHVWSKEGRQALLVACQQGPSMAQASRAT